MGCRVPIRFLTFLTGAALAMSGCAPAVSSVSGTVTVGGQPVMAGQVSFVAKTGAVKTAEIKNGSYTIDGVPLGEMTVLVFGPPPPVTVAAGHGDAAKKLAVAGKPAPAAGGPVVPAKYGDVSTSDLRYTVTPGANTYDPPLK